MNWIRNVHRLILGDLNDLDWLWFNYLLNLSEEKF